MAQISVSWSNSGGILLDRQTGQVEDLLEACDYATAIERSLIATASLQDWRCCWLPSTSLRQKERLESSRQK
jgi:hypothetical protein